MPSSMLAPLCLLTVLVATSVAASPSLCTFRRNGDPHSVTGVTLDLNVPGDLSIATHGIPALATRLQYDVVGAHRAYTLHNRTGHEVRDVKECAELHGGEMYVMRRGDLWVFPGVRVGHVETIYVGSERVTIRTLSLSPRVIEITGLVSPSDVSLLLDESSPRMTDHGHIKNGTMSVYDSKVLPGIERKLAASLHLPSLLIQNGDGYRFARRPEKESASINFNLDRDYYLPHEHPDHVDISLGRNRFITLLLPLLSPPSGGALFIPTADASPRMARRDPASGHVSLLLPPKPACSFGLVHVATPGSFIALYDLDPIGQMAGVPDPAAVYQWCDPIGGDHVTMRMAVMNKTWYATGTVRLLRMVDYVITRLFGVSVADVMTEGYGWDWHEEVEATWEGKEGKEEL